MLGSYSRAKGRGGGPKRRDWLTNLEANPSFTSHLTNRVQADLPATATVVTDLDQRHDILQPVVEQYNARWTSDSPWPYGNIDEWVSNSPLALVTFADDQPERQAEFALMQRVPSPARSRTG